jgi:hypothetical protein
MTSLVEAPPQSDLTRGGMLARLGGAVVGIAAADLITARSKAFAHAPQCCYGLHGCYELGCSCPGQQQGDCCWACTDSYACKTWRCCDRWDLCGGCICVYLQCNCC